jgi:anti-sigma factor RsiW
MLTCRDATLLFSNHLDGTVPPAQALALKTHLAACPACDAFLQGFRATTGATRAVLLKRVPADLAARVSKSLEGRSAAT